MVVPHIQTFVAERTPPPARAAATRGGERMRMRLEDEKKTRVEADSRFGTNPIATRIRRRCLPIEERSVAHSSEEFPAAPGVGLARRRDGATPDVARLCAGMTLELLADGGSPRGRPFLRKVEDAPNCHAWTVRGLWSAWVVVDRMSDSHGRFRCWQYSGTMRVKASAARPGAGAGGGRP